MNKKICSRCKEPKDLEDFAWKDKKNNKKHPACKKCMRDAYYSGDAKIKHLEKCKEYRNSTEGVLNRKLYIESGNRSRDHLKYKKTDKGQLTISKYNFLSSSKIKRYNYTKLYRKTDKGKLVAPVANSKRRALKLNVNEHYSLSDREYTLNLFNNKCFNCNSLNNITVDHHKPLSKGNGLSRTNAVVLCQSCNSKKHNKDPNVFYTLTQIKLLEESYDIIS